MSNTRTFLWTLAAGLAIALTLALMACGPTTQPDSPEQPAIAQANPQTTPTPTPTPGIDWTSTVEPHPDNPMLPLHDPMLTPKAPYTPEPTRVPQIQPLLPGPVWDPPAHPGGVAACKEHGMFEEYKLDTGYHPWCSEQAAQEIVDKCRKTDSGTAAELHACGKEIASEYRSLFIRFGAVQCYAIDDNRFPNEQHDCVTGLADGMNKASEDFYNGWAKVHKAGNAAPTVQAGINNLVSCLVERGHPDAQKEHILFWQLWELPWDYDAKQDALSDQEKELRGRLVNPTVECANEQGFFEIQDAAWTAALEKLAKEDPEGMEIIIREGMLVHLQEPGPAAILAGSDS